MKIDKLNKIITKAKKKKDGIWSYDGVVYKVKNYSVIGFIEDCNVFSLHGHFATCRGKFSTKTESKNALKILK